MTLSDGSFAGSYLGSNPTKWEEVWMKDCSYGVMSALFRYSQFYMEVYERMLEAGDGAIDILRCCDDYGTPEEVRIEAQSIRLGRKRWNMNRIPKKHANILRAFCLCGTIHNIETRKRAQKIELGCCL